MRPAVKVVKIAGASRHSRLETEPTAELIGCNVNLQAAVMSSSADCLEPRSLEQDPWRCNPKGMDQTA